MNKLTKVALLSLLPISSCFAVAVSTAAIAGAAAAAAANNSRCSQEQQNQRMNQERFVLSSTQNNTISGVFICYAAGQEEQRGYYGFQYDTCKFWNRSNGYYSLPISKVPQEFLPGKEIVNVFFDHHNQKFEFYYR